MKKALMITGLISVVLGVMLRACAPEPEEAAALWEKIPDEETETYIKETEQEKNMGLNESVQDIETGQLTEELPPAAGQVNEFTYEEAQLLMKAAQAEAGNQGEDGMWLVMSVIVNRTKDPDYPESVKGVIYQAHQFSTAANGSIASAEPTSESHEALARIESGDVAPGIIGFETTNSTELDKYFARAFEFRDHRFYTKLGSKKE